MKLALFDIDGTLTNTQEIDQQSFVKAYKDLFDYDISNVDWNECEHYTDSGIAEFVFLRELGRPAGRFEVNKIKKHLMDLFFNAFEADEHKFSEVKGANDFLEKLKKEGWAIAIATGCWEDSAIFKLNCAGIDYEEIPVAHSDHDMSRTGIINKAIELAKEQYAVNVFEKVVYFGDGLWDVKATSELNIPMIGIDVKGSGQLKDKGVVAVYGDFHAAKII
jgi:phosphoglycolate phosphatase-like HAD superfamily hydrolase